MRILLKLILALSGALSAGLDKGTLGNIKRLTIKSIQNQGKLQDDYECLASKYDDEIVLEYESGGQRTDVLRQDFGANGFYRVNQNYICQDTAIFHLTEKDAIKDDKNSFKIGCRDTGDFEMNPWMDITLESVGCYWSSETVSYRIYYEIHEIDKVSFAQLRYIYNINSPSEFKIGGKQDL